MKFSFNPLTSQFELTKNGCDSSGGGGTETFASTPTIQNVVVDNANEELAIILPSGTRKILIKVRDYTSALKFSYVAGESGTNYISINRGNSYVENDVLTITVSNTIYIQSTKPNVVIECLTWV